MGALRLSWRNLWRNGRRTAITAVAVALNTAILISTFGLIEGMLSDVVANITRLQIGDAQVHALRYRTDRSFFNAIPHPEAVLQASDRAGVAAAPRAYSYGLLSIGHKSAGALFWGVEPARERAAFDLPRQLGSGRFLADRPRAGGPREIVLGRALARSIEARVGTELVAVVQAADGSLGDELFTVVGVLKSCGEEIDRSAAILHADDFAYLFVSAGRVHEIALSGGGKTADAVVAAVREAAQGLEVLRWQELLPSLWEMLSLFDVSLAIFGLIFFLAAGLGVLNTMLMATYERMREFGVLKALGATPGRILCDVTIEALLLGLVSTAAGLLLGLCLSYYLQANGIDLTFVGGDITFSGVAFNPIWRAKVTPGLVAMPVVLMWLTCVLAALYPALKAARLDPVRAMTHV